MRMEKDAVAAAGGMESAAPVFRHSPGDRPPEAKFLPVDPVEKEDGLDSAGTERTEQAREPKGRMTPQTERISRLGDPFQADKRLEEAVQPEHTDRKQLTCIICNRSGREGIVIISEFICEECEAEMVRTDVKDAKYPFFIRQMKQIWHTRDA